MYKNLNILSSTLHEQVMHKNMDKCVNYEGQNPTDVTLRGSHWLERRYSNTHACLFACCFENHTHLPMTAGVLSQLWVSGVSSMSQHVDSTQRGHGAGQVTASPSIITDTEIYDFSVASAHL